MLYKQNIGYKILFLIVFASLFCFAQDSSAANYALEISNVEEAGDNNRIRFAYPGIEYQVVMAAVGGAYPFVWELTSAPSGMQIDPHSGIITWSNPVSTGSPFDISVKVTDKEGSIDSESYSLTVTDSTSRFIWMNANTTEVLADRTGSYSHPFKNFSDFWASGNQGNKICYMKAGTYSFDGVDGINGRGQGSYRVYAEAEKNPIAYVGYPGDSVYFDGTRGWNGESTGKHWALNNGTDRYFQNINFENAYGYSIEVIADNDRCTIFDCTFDDLVPASSYQNDAFISLMMAGQHEKWVLEKNDFSHAAENFGSAIKTYTTSQMVVQDCTFVDISDVGINWKGETIYSVARNNKFIRCDTAIGPSGYSDGVHGVQENEICFNYIADSGSNIGGGIFGNIASSAGLISNLHIYRNTINNDYIIFKGYYINDVGHYIYDNIILNELADTPIGEDFNRNKCRFRYLQPSGNEAAIFNNNFTFSNNLLGTVSSGILDSDGNLVNRSYVGTYGWEVAPSEYWSGGSTNTAPNAPMGLAVS